MRRPRCRARLTLARAAHTRLTGPTAGGDQPTIVDAPAMAAPPPSGDSGGGTTTTTTTTTTPPQQGEQQAAAQQEPGGEADAAAAATKGVGAAASMMEVSRSAGLAGACLSLVVGVWVVNYWARLPMGLFCAW